MKNVQTERKDDGKQVVPTPVCLPRLLIAELDAQASREGVFSRSAIIRRACREYLDRWGNKPAEVV